MRSCNGNLAFGTSGNPQISIQQEEYAYQVEENERALKNAVSTDSLSMIDEELIEELSRLGTKFNRKEMVFITRDATGQIVWLEKGTKTAGLTHIQDRGHIEHFSKAFGINPGDFESYLYKVVRDGIVLENKTRYVNGHKGYERKYYYEGNYCVLTAIGSNGFIISAYPRRHKEES